MADIKNELKNELKEGLKDVTESDRLSTHKQNLKDAQSALVAEFHALVNDTEALLKHTSDSAGEQVDELRTTLSAKLTHAKELLKNSEETLRDQAQAAVAATESYVQEKPLQAIGIAAGIGLVLGLLIARR